MTKVKICGLKRTEDTKIVNEYLPEYAGFVFANSKRKIDIETAKILRAHLDNRIKVVGVFVDEDINVIVDMVKSGIIDMVQLHGGESEEYIGKLKEEVKAPIIKAFGIKNKDDIGAAMQSLADYILLDNHIPGSGKSFDWDYLASINRKFFLAGGINPQNIDKALEANPHVIDVSSGVETNGFKDKAKIEEIIRRIRE
ncbi:MAG: phosphoribosylanthranilate isomerase [Suipraeoptans sp.]